MIITQLTGGLGNQMFQYAAGLALAERRRTVLKLDVSWFGEDPRYEAHNRYALSCLNITEQFATDDELRRFFGEPLSRTERWSVSVARALRLYGYVRRHTPSGLVHEAKTFAYYPELLEQPDGCYLKGLFQSERFFESVSGMIRAQFSSRYPPAAQVVELAKRITGGPSAALHFRRGDYVRNPEFTRIIGVVGLDYYMSAVRLLRERSPEAVLYIFSDDIEAVAKEFKPPGPHEFVRIGKLSNAYDKIHLMSLCEHIAIANSTFSWWAAWLNLNPGKLVIAPEPWLLDSTLDQRDVIPSAWIRLPRSSAA